MRLPSFFKSRQPKQFEFTPRYYNESKEAMQERRARIKAELERERGASISNYSSDHLRGSLKQQWQSNKNTSSFSKKSNSRILLILVLLFGLAYMVLK